MQLRRVCRTYENKRETFNGLIRCALRWKEPRKQNVLHIYRASGETKFAATPDWIIALHINTCKAIMKSEFTAMNSIFPDAIKPPIPSIWKQMFVRLSMVSSFEHKRRKNLENEMCMSRARWEKPSSRLLVITKNVRRYMVSSTKNRQRRNETRSFLIITANKRIFSFRTKTNGNFQWFHPFNKNCSRCGHLEWRKIKPSFWHQWTLLVHNLEKWIVL